MSAELTEEEFDIYVKYKTFLLNQVKEIEKVNLDANKKLFILADSILGIIQSIEKANPSMLVWILNKLNKGEKNDSVDKS